MNVTHNFNYHFPVGKPQYFTKITPEMNSAYPNTLGTKCASQCIRNYDFHSHMTYPTIDTTVCFLASAREGLLCSLLAVETVGPSFYSRTQNFTGHIGLSF